MRKRQILVIFLALSVLPLWFQYTVLAVPAEHEKSERYITINFEDVDINLFIRYISELTGKNFVVDKTVKGKVTVISPTQITEEEAFRVFESVLDVHGYTLVDSGPITKVLPSVKARTENVRTFRSDKVEHPEDQIVTQLIPLQYTSPDDVKKVLQPLISKTSVVIAHTQSGMLIVTDTLANIQRLLAIIKAIDVAYTGEDTVVLPLEYASAEKIGKVLDTLFQKTKTSAKGKVSQEQSAKIVPYERINALIVVAVPAEVERVRRLVRVLDVAMESDSGNIHVAYLQNANAVDVAKVLNFLPQQASTTTTKDGKKTTPAISKEVKIMADEETNSLIISASPNEFKELESVIKKLDIPRRMVYLEALILEVSTTKSFDVGVEWALGGSNADGTGTVVSGYSGSDDAYSILNAVGESSPPAVTGFSFGLMGTGIKIGGITFPSIGAVLNAYKTDSDISIISTPQILTTDNKEAIISVGENVPYITSQNTSSSDEDYTSYDYKDVSTKLTITPHISQANTLRLEIETEVIKLKNNTDYKPTTYKRTASTNVVVRNNETVVIGGIIGQDSTNSNTRVPLLGDIPVLGALFRNDSDSSTKTNMFIFITPKIIKNPSDMGVVTKVRQEKIAEDIPDAKEIFRQTNQPHAEWLCELGFDEMRRGENAEAKKYFAGALEVNPGNPYALYNLAVIAEKEGHPADAKKLYQQVIASGTTVTAVEAEIPGDVGAPLIKLARVRLENLMESGGKDQADRIFEKRQ